MHGGWIFLLALVLLVLLSYLSWILYSRHTASRLGLPPPSLNPFARSSSSSASGPFPAPASGGIRGFFDTQVRKFKNRNNRYATGAYEEAGYGGGAGSNTRGRSRLDPDEAWDTRVGNEAVYEEQELGLHAPEPSTGYRSASPGYAGANPYGGGASQGYSGAAGEGDRGRSRTREYDEADERSLRNPFGDENAASSLRGVSPKPLGEMDTSYGGAASVVAGQQPGHKKNAQSVGGASLEDSPTERRSMFRENM